MARLEDCPRCGTPQFTTDREPHLCKDLRARLARQEAAIAIVTEEIAEYVTGPDAERVALVIVKRLAGRDLGV